MDQKTFREKILSNPFAEDLLVLEAANADEELREFLFTARGVEAGIKDLLAAVPVPASLYGKLVTLPDDNEEGEADKDGDIKTLMSNSSSFLAKARAAAQQYRLAILIVLIIAITASLSIFLPSPAP
jgi:hypothetical protein